MAQRPHVKKLRLSDDELEELEELERVSTILGTKDFSKTVREMVRLVLDGELMSPTVPPAHQPGPPTTK